MGNTTMTPEPDLPVTPTNEGRNPELKNFGYGVAFQQLWPLGLGLLVSCIMAFVFFAAGLRPFHWAVCLVLALLPVGIAHFYLKKFVEGALPHTQEDKVAGWTCLRPDWSRPLFARFPLIPSLRKDLSMAAVPPWHSGTLHPLMRLRREFSKPKK